MSKIPARLLIVDDDPDVVQSARVILRQYFEHVFTESNPQAIPFAIRHHHVAVVLLDMNFTTGVTKGTEGLFWLKQIRSEFPDVSVIMVTAYGDVHIAVEAMKAGATDFVVKPWSNEKLIATVTSAYHLATSRQELSKVKAHQARMSQMQSAPDATLIGTGAAMQHTLRLISKVAHTDANILILGENGTGKELVAKSIHHQSARTANPFIKVDVGALTPSLFESELFGHKKGAFTDARTDYVGRFELASGGTLFLDEIGNLPPPLQIKLLTVLQNREVTPVGSSQPVPIDIRLISATNQSLKTLTSEGTFREDLLFRLNTIEITLPPLRERLDDLPQLLDHFVSMYGKKYGKMVSYEAAVIDHLQQYHWPGNIRELQHAVERAVIMSEGADITPEDFPLSAQARQKTNDFNLDEVERQAIVQAIQKHKGNLSKAAQELGLGRTTLYRKIERYGITTSL
jgi:two-component system response regulator HydG